MSRELYDLRDQQKQDHTKDLLIVGAMGHSSSVALGIALQKPSRTVYCIDGDGAALMHLGSLATIGSNKPRNLCHILLNNGTHDSVGGQKTVGFDVDFPALAKACGYTLVLTADDEKSISSSLRKAQTTKGAVFIEIRIQSGARDDLPRPKITPITNKKSFMNYVRDTNE